MEHGQATRYNARGAKCLAGLGWWPPSPSPSAGLLLLGGSALAVLAVGWGLGRFERAAVVGDSMAPGLLPGDRLLVRKLRKGHGVRPGDIVVATGPREPDRTIVKRVAGLDGKVAWLVGDNSGHSTDSRDFGPVPLASIVGRAVYRYSPASRGGRLGRQAPASTGLPT